MQPFTISDLADIIGAEKINFKEDIIIKNITTDSRSIPSDALFVALRGERFDTRISGNRTFMRPDRTRSGRRIFHISIHSQGTAGRNSNQIFLTT